MKSRNVCQILILILLLSVVADAGEPARDDNISYRSEAYDSEYAQEQCKLDIIYPAATDGYPTIVWFHGGGLSGGVRQNGELVAKRFLPEGIAVVQVSYRLSPRVKCPVYNDDAAAAIAWTFKNIKKYNGDPDKIFISGHSAGGYLTMILGMDESYLAKYDIATSQLAGLIPISGQTITHSTIRRERNIPRSTILIDKFAPLFHSGKIGPPCLCICGENDNPLRCEENKYFVAAQKNAGNDKISYLEVEGRDHSTIFDNLNQPGDEVATAMLQFIKDVIGAN
jgi:acetyl esterase/lipase